jgi:hypothetical protein
MTGAVLLVLGLLVMQAHGTGVEAEREMPKTESLERGLGYLTGAGIFGLEFIGIPVIDRYLNWGKPPRWGNPLKNLSENEPYHQDELWHFVGAASTAQLNYSVLENYFGMDDPLFTSAIMTLLFWTWMECLDGMGSSGFSIRDQLANLSGVVYSSIKQKYPEFPLYVRLGVRDYVGLISKSLEGDVKKLFGAKYRMTKVEIIYMAKNFSYAGFVVSNGKKNEDKMGLTMGFDIVRMLNNEYQGWWSKPLGFFCNHLCLSVNFTYWIN